MPAIENPAANRLADLKHFYDLLWDLGVRSGGPRKLSECSGRMDWPRRGVYFFCEPGEDRRESGIGPRVVRVGTHALKAGSQTKLWSRLSQHRGPRKSGGGNHRGSIFRLLVGAALIKRDGLTLHTWGVGSSARREVRDGETLLEQAVSKVLGAMPFLYLPVEDDPHPSSVRGIVERNAIALLSNFGKAPLDPPSEGWLGNLCPRERVRGSGLWNQNHVDEVYDPGFLARFEALVLALPEKP